MTAPPARPHILKTLSVPSRWSVSSPANEWGEDDAWDSGSDSESKAAGPATARVKSPSNSVVYNNPSSSSHVTNKAITTASAPHNNWNRPDPIPISPPRKTSLTGGHRHRESPGSTSTNGGANRSSGSVNNLSFSYTHVQHPSPSSYPPASTLSSHPESDDVDWQEEQERDERERAGWTIVRSDDGPASASRIVEDDEPDETDLDGSMVVGTMHPVVFAADESDDELVKQGPDAILPEAEDVVKDPMFAIRKSQLSLAAATSIGSTSRAASPAFGSGPDRSRSRSKTRLTRGRSLRSLRKYEKVVECLSKPDVNMSDLRKRAWAGLPPELRPTAWPLLLGYLPLNETSRLTTLARKREEYTSLVDLTFASKGKDGLDQQIWHQIEIDVPRTRPGVRLWMESATQRSLERILYVWAIRHPASGYVQGINDLVTPFFQVFLSAYIDCDPEEFDPGSLPPAVLTAIEADSFWCLSRLLDGIQDNYISQQPGIQRSVKRMHDLVGRIDAPLSAHLEQEGVEFMQFAFRWMNCLLMREITVKNTIRMWDTYLAEGPEAFSQFHLYVCSAFLVKWSAKLRDMDFQGIIMFLQSLPTQDWGDHEVELLLSEAFLLNSVWHNAQSHLGSGPSPNMR